MKTFSQCVVLCGFLAVAFMPSSASAAAKQDPLVGTWLFKFDVAGGTVQGVANFNADGTFLLHDSGNLTQAIGPFPNGNYFTVNVGIWKRDIKQQRRYETVATAVILARGTTCSAAGATSPACIAAPALPLMRFKNRIKDLVLDKDLQTATATVTVSVHPVDDLKLERPFLDPKGNKLADIPGKFEFRRLAW